MENIGDNALETLGHELYENTTNARGINDIIKDVKVTLKGYGKIAVPYAKMKVADGYNVYTGWWRDRLSSRWMFTTFASFITVHGAVGIGFFNLLSYGTWPLVTEYACDSGLLIAAGAALDGLYKLAGIMFKKQRS